jgi:hypothetical protein
VAGRIRSIESCNDLNGTRIRDLPACSIVPQPTTLPRVPFITGRSVFCENLLQNCWSVNSLTSVLQGVKTYANETDDVGRSRSTK